MKVPIDRRNYLHAFIASEAAGGIVLMTAATAALLVANSGSSAWYFDGLDRKAFWNSIMQPIGVQGTKAGRPVARQPALMTWKPSTSLAGFVSHNLSGLSAVVVGRSNIVGKPMAQLLLQLDCTVTMTHSRMCDLPDVCRTADIRVAAVGRPNLIRGSWLKPGPIVIDVGINRVSTADGKSRLVGDVDFEEALGVARHITPVPGGVGPMTIACLLANTLTAFKAQLAAKPV